MSYEHDNFLEVHTSSVLIDNHDCSKIADAPADFKIIYLDSSTECISEVCKKPN